MPIDKSNSKPWVKVTVWVLTFALIFAFMGTSVWLSIDKWDYWFTSAGTQTAEPGTPADQMSYDDAEMRAAYQAQVDEYERRFAEDDSDENRVNVANMNAAFGAWLFRRGVITEYPFAISLFERAADLDPDGQRDMANLFINQMNLEMGQTDESEL